MKIVGIDTGVNTGLAIYCTEASKLERVSSLKIHQAMKVIETMDEQGVQMKVFVEDARLATFGLSKDKHKAQGAGSIKRDAKIWEDFLTDLQIPFKCVRPNPRITKWDSDKFKAFTGWVGRTSEHARDAGMIAFTIRP